jgi:hypothetical protein
MITIYESMGMGHDGSRLMNDDDVFFVLFGFSDGHGYPCGITQALKNAFL